MRGDHEVLHLTHSIRHQEARDQDIGVGEIELLEIQPSPSGPMRNRPPRSASRIAAKTLGERGQQYQSIVPSVPTSATCAGRRSARARRSAVAPAAPPAAAGATRDRVSANVERHHGTRTSPSTPSSRAARARAARPTAAGARRRSGGSCPRGAARPSWRSPLGTAPRPWALRPPPRLASRPCRATSGRGRRTPPAWRQLVPEPDGRDRCPPLDHRRPVLVPVLERVVAAEHDQPSAGRSARNERSEIGPPRLSTTTSTPPASSRTRARKSSFL